MGMNNQRYIREGTLTLSLLRAAALAMLLGAAPVAALAQDAPFRIARDRRHVRHLFRQWRTRTRCSRPRMAVEDFGGKVLGRPIEVISADHQSKPDIGASLARQYIEQQGVSAIIPGGASSVGLAVQAIAPR